MKKSIIFFFICNINSAFSASCCGGGSSSSLILTGDNVEEYSLGLTYRNDLGQTDNEGWATFHSKTTIDRQIGLNFQIQRQLNDRFQGALKTGLINKDINKQNRHEEKMGFADVEFQASYEFLPEYTYSLLKPRGFIYSKASIPMSKSLYNSNSPVYSDVRGSGLYSLAIGSFFIKNILDFTFKTSFEIQNYFGLKFSQTQLHDYQKYLIPFGMSYAFKSAPISIGTSFTWSYQQAKEFSGTIHTFSQSEYFWELNFFANWTISREQALGLSYSDSTLIGKNINSPLYRNVALTFTKSIPL